MMMMIVIVMEMVLDRGEEWNRKMRSESDDNDDMPGEKWGVGSEKINEEWERRYEGWKCEVTVIIILRNIRIGEK